MEAGQQEKKKKLLSSNLRMKNSCDSNLYVRSVKNTVRDGDTEKKARAYAYMQWHSCVNYISC